MYLIFKSLTGLELEIEGEVTVKRFPSPHIVINSMYVHNVPGGLEPFILTIKVVEVWPSYKSLLQKHLVIWKVNIDDVDIELEHLKNDTMNWKNSMTQTPSVPEGGQSGIQSRVAGAYINITNASLRYMDLITNNAMDYRFNVALRHGGAQSESTVKGDVTVGDKNLTFFGNIGNLAQALSAGEVPAELLIKSDKSELKYGGNFGYRDGKIVVNGNVKLTMDDIVPWIGIFSDASDKNAADANTKPLPMEVKSDIASDNGKIIFPHMVWDGALLKGNAHVEISPPYGFDVSANINTLDLETLFASRLFTSKEIADPLKENSKNKEGVSMNEPTFIVPPKTFFNSLNFTGDIKIEDTLYNQQHISNAHIQLDMAEGTMTISQAFASLPGNARIVFAGIGKESYQGFALEGQIDSSGSDFAETVKIMKANGAAFPAQDFKRFHIKANSVVSAKEMRLSEVSGRIENMAFVGGIIATFGARLKLNAVVRIGGLNIDHFIDIWGIHEWLNSLFSATAPDAKYDAFIAHWLRQLDFDATMTVVLQQFFMNGNVRDRADFNFMASSGKLALNNVKTQYNGSNIIGNFLLDVTNPLPKLDIKAALDKFDIDTFFYSQWNACRTGNTCKRSRSSRLRWRSGFRIRSNAGRYNGAPLVHNAVRLPLA